MRSRSEVGTQISETGSWLSGDKNYPMGGYEESKTDPVSMTR